MRQLGLSDVILLCESNDLECYSNVKVSKGSILNSKAKVVFTKPYINGYITKDTAIITINQKFEQQIEPLDLMTIVSQPPKNQIQANAFLMQTSSSIDDIHHAIVNLNVLMEMDVVSGEYIQIFNNQNWRTIQVFALENFNYNSDHYQIHLSPLLFANLGFNYLNTDITVLLRKPLDSFEYFANSILVAPVGQRILKEETNILDRCVNPMKVYFQKQRTHFLGDLFAIVPDLSVDTVDSIENDTLFKKSVAGQSVVYFKIIQAQVENTQLDQNIEFKTISETTQIVQSGSVAFSRLPFSSESSFLLSIHPFIEKLNQYILPFIDTSAHFKSILIHEQKVSTSPKLVQLADLFGTRLGYNVYTLSFKMILRKLGIHDASLIHACSMSSKIIAELEVHLENCLNEIKNIRPCLLLIADVQSLSSTKVQTNSLFIDNADDEEEEHDNAQTNQNLLKINEKRVCILMQDFLNSISQLQNPNMNLETFSRHSFNGLPSVFVIGCLEFLELNQLNSSFQNLFQDTIVQKPLTSLDVMNILKQSFVNNLQNDDYLDMDLEKLSQILKGLELDSLSKIIQESKRIAFLRVYEYAVRQLQSKSIHKSDSGIIVDSEKQVELDDSMNEFVKDDFNHLSYMEKNEICEMILDAGYHIIQKDVEKSMELVLNNISNKPTSKFTLATNPNVSWDDIGGLERAKREILETVEWPIKHSELFDFDNENQVNSMKIKKRSGILLYGPPGTGKTLLAKAVASSLSHSFLSVKGPELLTMYIGESEANIRNLFKTARNSSPCILFFDELDSVAGKRVGSNGSNGVMERVVSQLLMEMDGISNDIHDFDTDDVEIKKKKPQVFVIAATNRPDLLDPSFLRPGRFDKLVYLDVAQTVKEAYSILSSLTRHLNLSISHDNSSESSASIQLRRKEFLEDICRKIIPIGEWTGADFSAFVHSASHEAISRSIAEETNDISITYEDFLNASKQTIPSVSKSELKRYRAMKEI